MSIRLDLLNTFHNHHSARWPLWLFYSIVLIASKTAVLFLVFCVNHCSFSRPSQKLQSQPWFSLSLLPHPTVTKSCQKCICSVKADLLFIPLLLYLTEVVMYLAWSRVVVSFLLLLPNWAEVIFPRWKSDQVHLIAKIQQWLSINFFLFLKNCIEI